MKILLANKFFYPRGGDCIHVIKLKNLLEKNGHQVAIFSMQHPENLKNEYSIYWPSYLEYGSKIRYKYTDAIARPLYSKEVVTKWNALLDCFQPDIVHLHNIHTQLSPIIAKESYKRGLPVFWTLHDFKLLCPAYSMLRDGKPCEKCISDKKNVLRHRCIKNSLGGSMIGYLEAMTWPMVKLEKYTTRFIAPSQFLKNKMVYAGFKSEKITQIYNFSECDRFNQIEKKEEYYVYLGRLSGEKGIETLLKVASGLTGYKLKIIGDGPLRRSLEEKYQNNYIQFLGYQPTEFVKPILSKARFLVLPSECYENNPLSIIESLLTGTPVLGSAIGGIPELVKPGKNGMLFLPGNEEDLSQKINKMMATQNWDYSEIAAEADKIFNEDKFHAELMNIYSLKD